ncbi:unnamed protein product [Bursaphelenchus okinawaensis]|uniref:oleoyl-[acyl-carrier-protein] hydrolase n=1 Tax=Bursaphelenchus okinawaensis TaxID=465554 RepID=A0A811KKS8_9BILA|nr:unnamed protein product [Bursaphelenchus okinawaensis]CAG9106697.1 unnamed protein product [Bursaphelenchus okinawaensis]
MNDMAHPLNQQFTVEVLERQLSQLFRFRLDVNDLDPESTIIQCNKETEGPVTFVHPIEGIATPLNRVMSKCTFPAYCFQFTRHAPTDSIESVADYYIKEMKKVQPEGPYRPVLHRDGSCIAFEMATKLQEQDGPRSVEKLILLDGSHLYMQTYRNVYRHAFGVTGDTLVDNPLFESDIFCAITLRFIDLDKKLRTEMVQLPNYKARINKILETVIESGFFESPEPSHLLAKL